MPALGQNKRGLSSSDKDQKSNGRCRIRTYDRLIKSQQTKNHKPLSDKSLTKTENPVFDTSLANLLQKYPDLAQVVDAWPSLPEHIKAAIKALIETFNNAGKRKGI